MTEYYLHRIWITLKTIPAYTRSYFASLQCFDAVGWAAGRASGVEKTEWWGAGIVICLERDADLHMAQLMPVKSRLVLPFRYRLTRVVLDKWPLKGCVCVTLQAFIFATNGSTTLIKKYWYSDSQQSYPDTLGDNGPCLCLIRYK